MLTARGWWFLTMSLVLTVFGLIAPANGVAITGLGLSLLAWFAWEWIHFMLCVRGSVARIRVRRRLRSGKRNVSLLWAGRSVEVAIRVETDSGLTVPYLVIQDYLPAGLAPLSGEYRTSVRLAPNEPVILQYQLQCPDPGVIRFEGVRFDVADLQGFFHHRVFVRQPLEVTVLPPLVNDLGHQRNEKFHNMLMPPGTHRLRQPGSGSELLDLRDYRPGDPPKMIAWKPSARRDRLITKEFESEVPVRCTMFVDRSQSVRLGPSGKTALSRLTALASALAQGAAAKRDLVGLTLVDEEGTDVVNPARGQRHLIQLTSTLARAARHAPAGASADIASLTRRGLQFADEVYPELLRKEVNRLPWLMYWRPLLDKTWGWFIIALFLAPLLVLIPPVMNAMGQLAVMATPERPLLLPTFIVLVLSPAILAFIIWGVHGLSGFFNPGLRRLGRRKRLAAVVAHHANLGPGGLALLLEDDEAFVREVQRFLSDHHVPFPVLLFDDEGRYQFRSPRKAEVLGRAITRAVTRAHDNELLVIMADLFELGDELEPVIKAVRVALARHHQVMVVCPWLPGIPPPVEDLPEEEWVAGEMIPHLPRDLEDVVVNQTVRAYHRSYAEVRRAFGRIGVPVVRANHGDPVRLILERLDQLRRAMIHR